MATLRTVVSLITTVGGEDKRMSGDRDLAISGDVVADVVLPIPENTSASPLTLWQASDHGVAAPASSFLRGAVQITPTVEGETSLPLDVELGYTSAAGAVTLRVTRLTAEGFLSLEPVAGATLATMTDRLTRIRAANPAAVGSPAGTNNRRIRLLLLK